jgi:acetoin utilization deacetylase AcuC-like enzyme
MTTSLPVFVHPKQYTHNPPYEWDKRGHMPHPETSKRIEAITRVLKQHPERYEITEPREIPWDTISAVHNPSLLALYQLADALPAGEFYNPTSFPISPSGPPEKPHRIQEMGFFCQDTSTPFSAEMRQAILWSAASAHAGAEAISDGGHKISYALSRPPGHHASATYFGGYCYLNNSAIAAHHLSSKGKVCVLDIDYHHGDGTQSIFYERNDVLTISVHADPTERFPFFSGFEKEVGEGAGEGFNLNVCLPFRTNAEQYMSALKDHVFPKLKEFAPDYLIIAFGADTYLGDPLCDFLLDLPDYTDIGKEIASLSIPTLAVQEGGYCKGALGGIIHHFLEGFL